MRLKKLAVETTKTLTNTIEDYDFSEEQTKAIQAIIENSILQAVEQTCIVHKEATVVCCGPEADIAHKIEYEARQKTNLLIANLSSLR